MSAANNTTLGVLFAGLSMSSFAIVLALGGIQHAINNETAAIQANTAQCVVSADAHAPPSHP